MTTKSDIFWIENPCKLFTSFAIFPSNDMSKAEKFNALTRLALIISMIMYFMRYKHTVTFLVMAILVIVALNYSNEERYNGKVKNGCLDGIKLTEPSQLETDTRNIEEFTIVPTYLGTDFQQVTTVPTFAEEWQIPPPAYDLYTNVPYDKEGRDTFDIPPIPQSYPYGQYLTKTNLLPSDEYYTHLGCGGAKTAREYVNSTFLRHSLANQDNMTRLLKKKLNRRFRHNSNDTYSPYHSY